MRKTCSNRKNTQNTKHLSYAQECRQNVGIRRGKGESGLGRCGKEWKKAGGLWIGAKNVYGL